MKNLPVLDLHLELPLKDGVPKLYAKDKEESLILEDPVYDGLLPGYDYSSLQFEGEEDIVLSEDKEDDNILDENKVFLRELIKSSHPAAPGGKGLWMSQKFLVQLPRTRHRLLIYLLFECILLLNVIFYFVNEFRNFVSSLF
ncbi:hypothetical protein ACOSQ3_017517 [Xanthoceras sorbifolium]